MLALIPVSKGAEPLEQILTNMDVDFAAEAGNKRQLQRKLINYLNSAEFDQVAGKEQFIERAQETLREHLGFAAVAAEDVNNVTMLICTKGVMSKQKVDRVSQAQSQLMTARMSPRT